MSVGQYDSAAATFERLAEGGDPALALLAARARLEAGDIDTWAETLKTLSKSRATVALALNELRVNGTRAPKESERLLKRMARKSPEAKGLLALAKASAYLDGTIRPLASKSTAKSRVAAKTRRKLRAQLRKLGKLLGPALVVRKGQKPSAAVLVPALDVLVGGLEALHGYLAGHERLLGRTRRRAERLSDEITMLENQAIQLGSVALGAAKQQAYSSAALRRLAGRLAARFPEDFGATVPWAVVCEDERPKFVEGAATEGVPAALNRLAADGHGALATALAQTCAPPKAADGEAEVQWAALRFALASTPEARVTEEVLSGAAAELAKKAEGGVALTTSAAAALASHFAGVDCGRALKLAESAGAPTPTLQRVIAACRGDAKTLLPLLEADAKDGTARALRRLADLLTTTAETEADATRVTTTLEQGAEAAGMSVDELAARPICAIPVQKP